MKQLNKCSKCNKRVPQVRSKFIDGKSLWFCDECYKKQEENKNE